MTQFHIENIEPAWLPLAEKYRHIFIEPSREVKSMWDAYGGGRGDMPKREEDLCNLRYGFEMHENRLPEVEAYIEKIQALLDKAETAGHEIFYKSFIFKEKFGSLRDQGDFYGRDRDLYYKQYSALSSELMTSSQKPINYIDARPKRQS